MSVTLQVASIEILTVNLYKAVVLFCLSFSVVLFCLSLCSYFLWSFSTSVTEENKCFFHVRFLNDMTMLCLCSV